MLLVSARSVSTGEQLQMNTNLPCSMYQVAVNGQCMSLSGQGNQCSSDGQCMGVLVCQVPKDYGPSSELLLCLPRRSFPQQWLLHHHPDLLERDGKKPMI